MADLTVLFPNGFDATKYAVRAVSTEPPNIAAWQHLQSLGYKPPFLQQGRLMRFPDAHDLGKGDKRGTGGWCIYQEFTQGDSILGILSFGSWHDGTRETWSSVNQDYMDSGQRQAFLDAIESARRVRDDEERKVKETARAEFIRIWGSLNPAGADHPYLVKKRCGAYGIKQQGDKLVIPIWNSGGLIGLQDIYPDGTKLLRKHSTKGFCIIEGSGDYVLIAEGYSTAASLHEATGFTVAIAFDAFNLFAVASEIKGIYGDKNIIIAADDDKHGETNTGLTQANKAANALGLRVISPKCDGTDFNDMVAESGLKPVSDYIGELLSIKQPAKRKADILEDSHRPSGALGLIYDYYNATSGYDQKGFAIQTALAIGSMACARNYKTDNENYSSIYLLNVGKTATGKEHCKTLINKIMRSANMDHHVIGDGFTSAGGVMTELLRKPRCLSVIDEFGMYLDAASNKGSSNQKEANSYLMQAIGRCHDVLMAKNYSGMTLGKNMQDLNDRKVCNPALSLVGLTTPRTFFDAISSKDIHSGFLNRFIVCVSNTQPSVRKQVEQFEVPEAIKDWLMALEKRAKERTPIEVSADFANHTVIRISEPAWKIQRKFDEEMVGNIVRYEPEGLDGLFGRAAEMAHRIALIMALSRDPNTAIVGDTDMQWACDYIRERYRQLFDAAKQNMTENDFDADCKAIIEYLEEQPLMKASVGALLKKFKKHSSRQMDEIISTLFKAEMIERQMSVGAGRPAEWIVRKE